MRPNLRPAEGAIGKSRQEGDGVRKISLAPQEYLEGRILRRNDSAGSGVVAEALAAREPRSSRRCRGSVDGRVGNCADETGHVMSPLILVIRGIVLRRCLPTRWTHQEIERDDV